MSRALLDLQIKPKAVQTELWGTCYVRRAMASELDEILKIMDTVSGSQRFVRLVQLGACDANGQRLFSEQDGIKLMQAPMEPIGEIAVAFLEANGITGDAPEKKSSPRTSGSPSISPITSVTKTR